MVRKKKKLTETDRVLAKNMVRLREGRGWKQGDLAREYPCKQPYISQLESGTRGFGDDTQKRLAQIFEISLRELLEMSKGFSSAEIEKSWNEFTAIKVSKRGEAFVRVMKILKRGSDDAVESLEGLAKILEKTIKDDAKEPPSE